MGKVFHSAWLLVVIPSWALAQKPATAPANEPRSVRTVRSPHSMGPDLKVPLCPAHFDDSLRTNGIAGGRDRGVTPPRVKTRVPALMTQQAIAGPGKTHIGNFNVIVSVVVDAQGVPQDLCLSKSSGYGLDASAATAVGQYRFEPAKNDGKPVKMRIPVVVRFAGETPPESPQPIPGKPGK